MRRTATGPLVVGLVALALASGAGSATEGSWKRDAGAALEALERSVAAGLVSDADAGRYRAVLRRAAVVRARVPPLRRQILGRVLAQIATYASPLAPRALALYATLEVNVDYLKRKRVPRSRLDVVGGDGTVYRAVAGKGLQFHPLANAVKLNGYAMGGDAEAARGLADALAARAVSRAGGVRVWEYPFDFGSVRAPWTSGMAQAVLAQALARAGLLIADPALLSLARSAFRAVPRSLDRELPAGPWVELYGGSSLVVLNAQLQSALSLLDYGSIAGDPSATAYARRLLATARALLPRFDTGHWSRYALGRESPLRYHDYVIGLLKRIAAVTGDTTWAAAAARFERYEQQPPALTAPTVPTVVYPRPRDGVRDAARVGFWLSKISRVTLVVAGKPIDSRLLRRGRHVLDWKPSPAFPSGSYAVRLVARDLAGNHGALELPPIEVARDRAAPALAATQAQGRLYWRARDAESDCCRIRLELRRSGTRELVILPARKGGSVSFSEWLPRGYWLGTLVALDAAGNRAEHRLGLLAVR